ncbi:MAG: hypothetical protein KME17_26400 [Cyanosarcina radialis HA8281-LM2]|nr:hypothetical protein [Cyanosarcina radialis HA8281-LM2]
MAIALAVNTIFQASACKLALTLASQVIGIYTADLRYKSPNRSFIKQSGYNIYLCRLNCGLKQQFKAYWLKLQN